MSLWYAKNLEIERPEYSIRVASIKSPEKFGECLGDFTSIHRFEFFALRNRLNFAVVTASDACLRRGVAWSLILVTYVGKDVRAGNNQR
jgi:hypothetical protein